MITQYFKQVLYQFKTQKLISWITVLGIAFSIAMIMVTVIIIQIEQGDYRPETHRSRTLYVRFIDLKDLHNSDRRMINYGLPLHFVKECFYPLKSAEAVTAFCTNDNIIFSQEYQERFMGKCRYVDTAYWKFFDFDFLYGKPFSEADFQSGIKKVVIRKSVARKMFHTDNAVGKTLMIADVPYTVCGVIRDCSEHAEFAYSDIYAPYTVEGVFLGFGLAGPLSCLILAHERQDFDKIRQEVNNNVARFNSKEKDQNIELREQPYTHFQQSLWGYSDEIPDPTKSILNYGITLIILLILPAINLSGLTLSRMQKRLPEIGIRRSFGAKRRQIISQVLNENLIFTFLGGFLGLILSYTSLFLMRDWLLNGDQYISLKVLASPTIFLLALLFCIVLNLLSSGISAWQTARKHITDAMK